jgi:hypothetical protein
VYSLFPGFNSTAINGDDMDGSGINFLVWPYVFDSFEATQPIILTPADTSVFSGCADYVVPCEHWTVGVSGVSGNVVIRRAA